jgi:hypothetical protein
MKEYIYPICMIVFILGVILGGLIAADYYLIRGG